MFKLRRPSICSDLDILSDSDSVSDVTDEIQKGVSINSISESKSLGSSDTETQQKKRSIINSDDDCDGRLNESERIEPNNEERTQKGHEFSSSATVPSTTNSVDGTTSVGILNSTTTTTPTVPNNYGTLTTTTAAAAIMCDRKRKERHESCTQGQEKKVIRSLSHEDPKGETGTDKSDFRRTQSDDFQPKSASTVDGDRNETDDRPTQQSQTVSMNGRPSTLNGEQKQQANTSNNPETDVDVDASSYGVGAAPNPQYGIVRNMPNFEAELQRQWERSAQWSSTGSRKAHSGRKHRSRSSSKSSTPSKTRSYTAETEDGHEDCEEATGEHVTNSNEDELSSPTSEESSTASTIDSLDEIENNEKLSCEDIETDVVADEFEEVRDHRLGNGNSMEPHLDFSTLHHQVETNEPISFLAALHSEVMLSPRNSILPSIPPSPPLYQTILDPPISRQHGGNQNMKMNQLSKQVSNLKRHLKSLEDEHEQLFGYKPSHADKLNHKEMRKCLLQFTKAKRELKLMREDPANIRTGGNLLQVMNSSTVPVAQTPFPRGSPEALKSLDDTVKEITKTLSEKRRQSCRPEDPTLMTQSELNDEKSAMQKQLLMLEKKHGRPISKEEKGVVKSIYDRYRSLKKLGSRLGNIKENSIDLVPILEYETLDFTSNETEGSNSTSIVELQRKDSLTGISSSNSSSPKEIRRRGETDEEEDGSMINIGNEGFTDMPLAELELRQMAARDEKRRLRSMLRKYDEKHSSPEMESIYQKYKKIRGTVRLLEILISKRKFPLAERSED